MSSSVGNITVSNGSFYVEVDGVSTKISIGSLMMAVSLGGVEEIDAEIATKLSEMVERNEQIEIALELISVVSERAESGEVDASESITINGTTKTLSEWLGDLGVEMPDLVKVREETQYQIDVATELISVISKQLKGGTEDFDLTEKVTVNGTTKTLEEWLGDLGVDIPDVVGTVDELELKIDATEQIRTELSNQADKDYDSDKEVTVDGVTKTIDEWCEYLGIDYTRADDMNWWEIFKGDDDRARKENKANAKAVLAELETDLETEKTRVTTNMETLLSDVQSVLDGLNTKLTNIDTKMDDEINGMVDTLLTDLQSTLDGLNTDSETATLELQNLSEKRSNLLQQASVFLKSSNDAMQSVLNNL